MTHTKLRTSLCFLTVLAVVAVAVAPGATADTSSSILEAYCGGDVDHFCTYQGDHCDVSVRDPYGGRTCTRLV